MYDHHRLRELHDSSPVALNNAGRLSASPRFKVSATLPAVVEENQRCDKSQLRNDVVHVHQPRKSRLRFGKGLFRRTMVQYAESK